MNVSQQTINNKSSLSSRLFSSKHPTKSIDQDEACQRLLIQYQKTLRTLKEQQDLEIDNFTPDTQDFLQSIHTEEIRTINHIYQHMIQEVVPYTTQSIKQLLNHQKNLFDKALQTSLTAKQSLQQIMLEKHQEKSKWKHVLQQEMNNMHESQSVHQMRQTQQKLNKIKKELLYQQEQMDQKHETKQKHLDRQFKKEMSQIATTLQYNQHEMWKPQLHEYSLPSHTKKKKNNNIKNLSS